MPLVGQVSLTTRRCHPSARVWSARSAALSVRMLVQIGTSERHLVCLVVAGKLKVKLKAKAKAQERSDVLQRWSGAVTCPTSHDGFSVKR